VIGLKAKSENTNDLDYGINLLHSLKLMPEAVCSSSSICHCMVCLFPSWPAVQDAHFSLMFAYDTAKLNDFANIIRVAV
jgi:hypothetical protein